MKLHSDFKVLGRNIQILMDSKNLSNIELANSIKYDRDSLSKLVTGHQNIRLNTLLKICAFFDVSVESVFDRNFENNISIQQKHYIKDDYVNLYFKNLNKIKQVNRIPLSQKEIDPAQITKIKNKFIKNPTINTLFYIASDYSTDLKTLFHNKEE